MFYVVVLFNILLCIINLVFGISETSVQERQCMNPPPVVDPNFNYDWAMQQKKWYVLYGSKEVYYRLMDDLLKNNKTVLDELPEEEIFECMVSLWTKDKYTAIDVKGQVAEFKMISPSKGTFVFKSDVGTGGYAVVTMSEMVKGFLFFVECWDGNQQAWSVISANKNGVDKETEDKIYAHAKSLGFNEKYFFKSDQSQCGDQIAASSDEDDK